MTMTSSAGSGTSFACRRNNCKCKTDSSFEVRNYQAAKGHKEFAMKRMFAVLAVLLAMATSAFAGPTLDIITSGNTATVTFNSAGATPDNVLVSSPSNNWSYYDGWGAKYMDPNDAPWLVYETKLGSLDTGSFSSVFNGSGVDFNNNPVSITLSPALAGKWKVVFFFTKGNQKYYVNTGTVVGNYNGAPMTKTLDGMSWDWALTGPAPTQNVTVNFIVNVDLTVTINLDLGSHTQLEVFGVSGTPSNIFFLDRFSDGTTLKESFVFTGWPSSMTISQFRNNTVSGMIGITVNGVDYMMTNFGIVDFRFNGNIVVVVNGTITIIITVNNQLPVIACQPSDLSLNASSSAVFTVVATNATSYQWYRNGSLIAGATNASFSFTAQLTDDGSTFFVRVANAAGYVDSATVTLTVTANPPNTNKGIATFTTNQAAAIGHLVFDRNGAPLSKAFVSAMDNDTVLTWILQVYDTNSKPNGLGWSTDYNATMVGGKATFNFDLRQQDEILRFNVMIVTPRGTFFSLISDDAGTGWDGTLNGQPIQPDMSDPRGGAWQFPTGIIPVKGSVGFSVSGTNVIAGVNTNGARSSDLLIGAPDGVITSMIVVNFRTDGGLPFVREFTATVVNGQAMFTVPLNERTFRTNLKGIVNGVEYWFRLDDANPFWVGTFQGVTLIPDMTDVNGAAWQFDTGIVFPNPDLPVITGQPQSLTVMVDQSATFAVTATNATSYQWFKNGLAVLGATGASFSFIAKQSDDGSIYFCQVSNSAGSMLSDNATLTVTPGNPHKNGPGAWLWKASEDGNTGQFVAIIDGSDLGRFKTRKQLGWRAFNALVFTVEDGNGNKVGESTVRAFGIQPLYNILRPVGVNLPLIDDAIIRIFVTKTTVDGVEKEGWRTELDLRTFVNGTEGKRVDLLSMPVVPTPPVITLNSAEVRSGKLYSLVIVGQRAEIDLGLIGVADITATMIYRNHMSKVLSIVNGKIIIDLVSWNDIHGTVAVVATNDLGTDTVTIRLRPAPKH